LGVRVEKIGFISEVQGSGFIIYSARFRFHDLGFRIQGVRFGVSSIVLESRIKVIGSKLRLGFRLGFRVKDYGSGIRICGLG
jgi:hypothetical protein